MNLLLVMMLCGWWHTVYSDGPITLFKDGNPNLQLPELNDPSQSTENSKEKSQKPSMPMHADNIDAYTSGLTPQFRTLLLAPDSSEVQNHRRLSIDSQKERNQHESENKNELVYTPYRNEIEGTPQAQLDQLLRYYGKMAGKLLPQSYVKFRKIGNEKEKDSKDKPNESEVKESPVVSEASSLETKTTPSTEHVVSTAVNAAIANAAALAALQATSTLPGYGSLNYLNAANYAPPTPPNAFTNALRNRMYAFNYSPNQAVYGLPNCCNVCPPCTSQAIYENACGGNMANVNNGNMNNANNGMGCSNLEYNTPDADNDEYGQESYYQNSNAFGNNVANHENTAAPRHSQLLSGYAAPTTGSSSTLYGSSKQQQQQQPNNYYQVSSPVGSQFLVDSHPYSPTGSLFATSHMHHFGSYPSSFNSSPFQQFYGTLNAYPNNHRFNYGSSVNNHDAGVQNFYGFGNSGLFGPMFDYAAASELESTTLSSSKANSATSAAIANDQSKADDPAQIENIFHIVKPNFASVKKVALMKSYRTNLASKTSQKSAAEVPPAFSAIASAKLAATSLHTTTGSTPLTTATKGVLVARKMAKILIAKKSSTPLPKSTSVKSEIEDTTTKSPFKKPTAPPTSTSVHEPSNSTKRSRFS